jgi:hypothetical protein
VVFVDLLVGLQVVVVDFVDLLVGLQVVVMDFVDLLVGLQVVVVAEKCFRSDKISTFQQHVYFWSLSLWLDLKS